MYRRAARKVVGLFAYIDKRVLSFKAKSGMRCPRCSGICCKANYIEVTPLDVLPAVLHLEQTGELEDLLRRVYRVHQTCVFYSKRQTNIKNCHCRIYPLRPSGCRIFGFGAIRDKYGDSKLSVCKLQKKYYGSTIKRIKGNKGIIEKAVSYSNVSMMLYNIDPTWGSMHMHINDALRMVSEKMLLACQIAAGRAENKKRPKI